MARTVGSRNKDKLTVPDTVLLSTEARIELLANLLIDRILEEQTSIEVDNAA